jgi:hypothetical protein
VYRKVGIFDADAVQDPKNMSWLDRQHQTALKVLRRRANADKKDRQRRHVQTHGIDDASIARAEQVQQLISEGNYEAIDKLSSFGRHMLKQRKMEQLQQDDTLALTTLLQQHLQHKIAKGGRSEVTQHDKLIVLDAFLASNKRSPHLRAAISTALNLSHTASLSHPPPSRTH